MRRVSDHRIRWDAANNLSVFSDRTPSAQWPDEQRPRQQTVQHDSLYRVVNIFHRYRGGMDNPASDWRETQALQREADPMRREPAPVVPRLPDQRVVDLTYQYDWLANMVEWTDDAGAFYERSLGAAGQLINGFDEARRPTALYLSTNIRQSGGDVDMGVDRGGWVRLRYGESGNAETMTVRARCVDRAPSACFDDTSLGLDAREAQLVAGCSCAREQHYQYRWDELNRIVEARRYDRAGSGDWALQVRQRYRYDGGNVRTVKQSIDSFGPGGAQLERVALYVLPGDFERRGLVTNPIAMTYDASSALGTETQYLVSGTRVVWQPGATGGTGFERDARITLPMSNLIQSTNAVVDLLSGELLEVGTYYPNGARETLRSNEEVERFALEPLGFTGKEGDDEVGLTYFGERYLLAHLGRWASPDPLQVHQGGGGEFGNSYHYVTGSLLQARDPEGLSPACLAGPVAIGVCLLVAIAVAAGVYELGSSVIEADSATDEMVEGARDTQSASAERRAADRRLEEAQSDDEYVEALVRGDRARARAVDGVARTTRGGQRASSAIDGVLAGGLAPIRPRRQRMTKAIDHALRRRGASQRLATAMRRHGFDVPEGHAAHHLISIHMARDSDVVRRAVREGYDINAHTNGLALPTTRPLSVETGLPLHSGAHLGEEAAGSADGLLRRLLDNAQRDFDEGRLAAENLPRRMRHIESRMRRDLLSHKVRLQYEDPHWQPE